MADVVVAAAPVPPPPPPPPPLANRSHRLPRPPLRPVTPDLPPPAYPYYEPVGRSSATTIGRISERLTNDPHNNINISNPAAVAIGPYHHFSPHLLAMEATKRAAADEFFKVAGISRDEVRQNILPLAETTRKCYEEYDDMLISIDDGELAEMLLLDGCFLVQFMVSAMCTEHPPGEEQDPLMSRPEVRTHIYDITRDVLLLENQIPWAVLQALMDLRQGVPVTEFLDHMASFFDISSSTGTKPSSDPLDPELPLPHHLLGLFHRRQVGKVRNQSLRIDILPAPAAVELAEMGVKLTASKTKSFGNMKMRKHRWTTLGLFGELSLAPLLLGDLTACWLLNMAAYEQACLGATQADNFAVSSYVSVVAQLVNRGEDVQELRARGIINSAMSDEGTLSFFKWAAPCLRVGERYIDISQRIQQYKEKRWIWIPIHRFFYRYMTTIVAVVSVVGAFAGLLKLISARS